MELVLVSQRPALDVVAPTRKAVADVRALYTAHASQLRLGLARLLGGKADVDDVLQEIFVIAVRRKQELALAQSEVGWLYGVGVKLVAARRRRFKVRKWLGLNEAEHVANTHSPFRSVEQREAAALLHRALEELPSGQRETLVLFELQGLSGEEVAQALGIALPTVWTRLSLGRTALAAAVERVGGGSR